MISAREYLQAKLEYEIDVLAVAEGLAMNSFILVDTRKKASWDHGHIPNALHLPIERLSDDWSARLAADANVVVYGWGPGCNGATRAAAIIAERRYSVREMIGGFEYWCRSGLPIESATGTIRRRPDPLVSADGDDIVD